MSKKNQFHLELLDRAADSVISAEFQEATECCNVKRESNETSTKLENAILEIESTENKVAEDADGRGGENCTAEDTIDGRNAAMRKRAHNCAETTNNWAEHKNVAEGLMDIALLSANANQLRFLITYNNRASTYYISLGLIALSLILQVAVGIALIFKRRMKNNRTNRTRTRINEFLIGGVFMVTVVNVLLAAFTTTDGPN